MLRLGFRLLTLALAATLVAAESELAHAMEYVYFYSKYATEGTAYPNSPKDTYWIATNCGVSLNRRCTFNEFVSYLKYGNPKTGPAIIDRNGNFNFLDEKTVQSVVTKMASMKDPTNPRGTLLMAGNVSPQRIMPNNGIKGIKDLYYQLQRFDKAVSADIKKMPDGQAKTTARAMLDTSNNRILQDATALRQATRRQKLYEEMIRKFSPTGKFDKIYEYERDGKTQRFNPIQWTVTKYNLFGRDFQKMDIGATIANNKDLNDPILKGRVDDHLALFNKDGTDGRGGGLVTYDRNYPGTNGRHQVIIDVQDQVRKAYAQDCK